MSLFIFYHDYHFNTFKPDKADKSDIFYFFSKNLSYSFLTLSAVAFRPILIATSFQLFFSNTLYRIIRCILCGISFIQRSTSIFNSSANFFCSTSLFSSSRNLLSSSYVNAVPALLKCMGLYGNSGLLPETFVCTIVFRFFFNRVISFSVSFTTSHASMYCSIISFFNGITSP